MARYLLHSGGLDSHIAWRLDPTLRPVYVRHAARNEHVELAALDRLVAREPRFAPLIIKGLPIGRGAARDGHVRLRNLMLLATVAALSDADEVAFAAVRGEASADKSPQFIRAFDRSLRIAEGVRLTAPLVKMTKPQALAMALTVPGAWDVLRHTWSCYGAGPTECGRCQACYRRGLAMWRCGLLRTPPPRPTLTDGVLMNLRRTPLRRWPDLARANADGLRALLAGGK